MMRKTVTSQRPIATALIIAMIAATRVAFAAPTDLATEPLNNPAASTKPNVLFILDNSGSMAWDYSPDYMSDGTDGGPNKGTDDEERSPSLTTAENDAGGYRVCLDNKDASSTNAIQTTTNASTAVTADLKECWMGDPPFASPMVNKQYYNPEIRYQPPIFWNDTAKAFETFPLLNRAATSTWAAVPTDPYGVQQKSQTNGYAIGPTSTLVDLAGGYPDRLWCADFTDLDSACRRNTGGYEYPSNDFGRGKRAASAGKGNIRYAFGAPYYYNLVATEYCQTRDLITRPVSGGETCNAQTAPDSTYPHPAPVRWCTNAGFTDCQAKRIGNYNYPKFAGIVSSSAGSAAKAAKGSLIVGDGGTAQTNVNAILVNGVNILASGLTILSPAGGTASATNRSTFAASIRSGINGNSVASGYTACDGSQVCLRADGTQAPLGTVVISAVATGTGPNGFSIEATSSTSALVAARTQFTIINTTQAGAGSRLNTLTANGASIIGATAVGCDTNNETTCAGNVVAQINSFTATTGYSASNVNNLVTVIAPTALGSAANGFVLNGTDTSMDQDLPKLFAGGGNSPAIVYTSIPLAGGAEAIPAFTAQREKVGAFSRVDIVELNADGTTRTYPRGDDRTDCTAVAGRCSYDEEMTNFANWYAYYRTRMQMMKSATGRAFLPIGESYRIGFMTINFAIDKYLRVADFATDLTTGGQKRAWFDKLYAQAPSGGTPLRRALSRAGWIYAGKIGATKGDSTMLTDVIPAADDPVQFACQPNFAILSSDGYWNGDDGKQLNKSSSGSLQNISNEDGTNAGYSTQAYGAWDGGTGSSNTLADVALHYYKNDLRSTMDDKVKASQQEISSLPAGTAAPSHQRMITFTLGLGLDGLRTYDKNYDDLSNTTSDFFKIRQDTLKWPNPATDGEPAKLDDLWHAAVNGRGKFFSAANPQDVESGLTDALSSLEIYTGAGAAAATSNLQPVAGDNFAFTAQYTSVEWTGDVRARTIDLDSGIVSNVSLWSAATQLNNRDWATRQIYTFDAADTAGNKLKSFCWPGSLEPTCNDGAGLDATEQAYFNTNQLNQYASWSITQRTSATSQSLLEYLRGNQTREDTETGASTDLYRNRASLLGDVVSAQPAYVRTPQFSFNDTSNPGFTEFRNCIAGVGTGCPTGTFPDPTSPRRATLYIAANDGFLHAFETDRNNAPYFQTGGINTSITSDDTFSDTGGITPPGNNAGNGEERWAFTPTMLMPKLHQLANTPYAHTYFVDGSPKVADACLATPCTGVADWRTILVGGLNGGGRGYYALDVTDPLAPKGLWEFKAGTTCLTDAQANPGTPAGAQFSDCHLGYTYGNPLVTKRNQDGRWVVIVASGYNNFNPGDGRGYLYVLDAATGAILNRISTGVGDGGTAGAGFSDADPSGLSRINGWVSNILQDNTTLTVYGGDLLGNMWRFDLDSSGSNPNYLSATKLFTATDGTGASQPISSLPEMSLVNSRRVIFFGTGRYVGTSDLTNSQTQTIYAIKDELTSPGTPGTAVISGRSDLVQRTFASGSADPTKPVDPNIRHVEDGPGGAEILVDWDNQSGWFVDLPQSGERVNVDPILQFGTLVVASNVPNGDACNAGGDAWINFLNYESGGNVSGYDYASTKNATSVIVGLNQILLPGGKLKIIATTAGNETKSVDAPVEDLLFEGRRVGWRELVVDR
jgi:type IV pilus assembly protein PilY1